MAKLILEIEGRQAEAIAKAVAAEVEKLGGKTRVLTEDQKRLKQQFDSTTGQMQRQNAGMQTLLEKFHRGELSVKQLASAERLASEAARLHIDVLSKEGKQLQALIEHEDQLQRELRETRGATESLSATLGKLAIAILSIQTLRMLAGLIEEASEYERKMTQIVNLTDVTREQLNAWRPELDAIAVATGQLPNQVLSGLQAVTSAGFAGAEAMQVTERSAAAAAVGLGDVAVVAKAVSAAVAAYGPEVLSAAEATDVLLATVRAGAAEADQIAPVLGRVVGIAQQLGVSFADVGAFVATFTRLGVNAEEAVTALSGTLNSLLGPTEAQKKALKNVNMEMSDLRNEITEKGLAVALVELVTKFKGNEDALAAIIPNVRALAGVLGTAGAQGEAFVSIQEQIRNSTGDLDEAIKNLANDPAHALDAMKVQWSLIAREIGQGALPAVAEFLKELSKSGPDGLTAAKTLGETLGKAIKLVGDLAIFAIEHLDELRDILILLGGIKLAIVLLEIEASLLKVGLAARLAKIASLELFLVWAATPIGALILSLAALAIALRTVTALIDDGSPSVTEYDNAMSSYGETLGETRSFVDKLAAAEEALAVARKKAGQNPTVDNQQLVANLEEERRKTIELAEAHLKLAQARRTSLIAMNAELTAAMTEFSRLVDETGEKLKKQHYKGTEFTAPKVVVPESVARYLPDLAGEHLEIEKARAALKTLEGQQKMTGAATDTLWWAIQELNDAIGATAPVAAKTTGSVGGLGEAEAKVADALAKTAASLAIKVRQTLELTAATAKGEEAVRRLTTAHEAENAIRAAGAQLSVEEIRNIQAGIPLQDKLKQAIVEGAIAYEQAAHAQDQLKAATERSNSAISDSVSKLAALTTTIADVNAGRVSLDASGIRKLMVDLGESGETLDKLRLELVNLPAASEAANRATAQLTSGTRDYAKILGQIPDLIKQARSAQERASRESIVEFRSEIDQIRERNNAIEAGTSAFARYEQQAQIKQRSLELVANLAPLPDEGPEAFGKRWLAAIQEARAAASDELRVEIAADFLFNLETPREYLDGLKNALLELTKVSEEGAPAVLKIAQAQAIYNQAVAELTIRQVNEQMSAWGGLFDFMSSSLDGLNDDAARVFAQIAQALNNVQGGYDTGSQLGQALGGTASAAAAGGAAGAIFALWVEGVKYMKGELAKRRAESYNYGASIAKGPGPGKEWNINVEGQARRASLEIQQAVETLADVLGGTIESFASLEIQVRRDGKYFHAFVSGQFVGWFTDMQSAVDAAILKALKDPATMFSGVSDLMRQGLEYAISDGTRKVGSVEELQDFLAQLREIEDLSLADGAIQIKEAINHFDDLWATLARLEEITPAVVQGFQNILDAELRQWQAWSDRITGRQASPQEELQMRRQEAEMFNAQRTLRIAELNLRKIDLQSQIEALKNKGNVVRIGADIERGELGIKARYLSYKADLVKAEADLYQLQIDALANTIAAIDALLRNLPPAIDPASLKPLNLGRGGGGNSSPKDEVRDFIKDKRRQLMPDLTGEIAGLNKEYDEQIKKAKGNADLIRQLNNLRQKEIDLIRDRVKADLITPYLGAPGSASRSSFMSEEKEIEKQYADLRRNAKALGIALWQVNQAERERIRLLQLQAAAAAGSRSASTRLEMEKLAEAINYLRLRAAENADLLNEIADEQFLALGDRLFGFLDKYYGDVEGFEDFRLQLEQVRFNLEFANMQLQFQLIRDMGILTAEQIAQVEGLFNYMRENPPDFAPKVPAGSGGISRRATDDTANELKQLREAFKQAKEGIRDFLKSLDRGDLGGVTPLAALEAAQSQFDSVLAKAKTGDLKSLESAPEAAKNLIDSLKQYSPALFATQLPQIRSAMESLLNIQTVRDGNLVVTERFETRQQHQESIQTLRAGFEDLSGHAATQEAQNNRIIAALESANQKQRELDARLARMEQVKLATK